MVFDGPVKALFVDTAWEELVVPPLSPHFPGLGMPEDITSEGETGTLDSPTYHG